MAGNKYIYISEEERLFKKEIWEILIYEWRVNEKGLKEIRKLAGKKERRSGTYCGNLRTMICKRNVESEQYHYCKVIDFEFSKKPDGRTLF